MLCSISSSDAARSRHTSFIVSAEAFRLLYCTGFSFPASKNSQQRLIKHNAAGKLKHKTTRFIYLPPHITWIHADLPVSTVSAIR
jgi:hypothetical protein